MVIYFAGVDTGTVNNGYLSGSSLAGARDYLVSFYHLDDLDRRATELVASLAVDPLETIDDHLRGDGPRPQRYRVW